MKILSIGNSFSQDAHAWLHELAKARGENVETVNLYIGGCSLDLHYKNLIENTAGYDYEVNGNASSRKISLGEALYSRQFDIVTLQQASHDSGRPQTYIPYVSELAKAVRASQKNTRLYLHETWAYEDDSSHPCFESYDCDQKQMYTRLSEAYEMASRLIGAPLIPVGEVIQTLRTAPGPFCAAGGGIPLTRDGFHLSLDYGRYAAAATWLAFLTGQPLKDASFLPSVEGKTADPALISLINDTVNRICFNKE